MHRARAAAAAAVNVMQLLFSFMNYHSRIIHYRSCHELPLLLLHELPLLFFFSFITVAVAILPPSPTFSPQPFPLETGIHQPHTAPPIAGRSCGLLLRDAAGAGGL